MPQEMAFFLVGGKEEYKETVQLLGAGNRLFGQVVMELPMKRRSLVDYTLRWTRRIPDKRGRH